MAALLAGLPSRVLGSDIQLETIDFQGDDHPVDDLQLTGESEGGGRRTAVIAVRHDPTIGKSDDKLVKLIATMAVTLARNRGDCRSGALRLGLVVGDPHTGAGELEELTELARASGDRYAAVLKKKVAASNAKLRARYRLFAEVLTACLTNPDPSAKPDPELVRAAGAEDTPEREQFLCELLASLYVVRADLEGATSRDTSAAVQMLIPVAGSVDAANAVWKSLIVLASEQNPLGGHVVEALVRRAMPQHELNAGQRHTAALDELAQLETALRDQVRSQLTQPAYGATPTPLSLHLPRTAELDALSDAIGSAHGDLLVTGAPSAGKSALAVAVIDRLRDRGQQVVALHAEAISGLGTATDPFAGKLADILAVAGSGKPRVLIIDGAESALDQLRNLTSAAHAANYKCVIVARDDVAGDVNDVLTSLEDPSGTPSADPIPYSIGVLTTNEIDAVISHFPLLATIATRPGAAALIARPGLIDAVLRSGPPMGLPGQALTELDVFARYWSRLVEIPRTGASARGRADAAITVARDVLAGPAAATGQILEPGAIDSLRLDGILATASPLVARDQFATDLDLDFATARCLIVSGLDQLKTSPRPRRAMRATRLAIQAQLTPGTVPATLADIRLSLDAIGADHGIRWTELADEALIGHSGAYDIVTELWASLSANPAALQRLLAAAERLYHPEGVAVVGPIGRRGDRPNPATDALGSLVRALVSHDAELMQASRDVRDGYGHLLIAYLRGVSWNEWPAFHSDILAAIAAACAARDAHHPPSSEAVALLGPEHVAFATQHLQAVARDSPSDLADAVDSPFSVWALADRDPALLEQLARRYYVDPDGPDHNYADDGVRDHTLHPIGQRRRRDRGPFHILALCSPEHGLPLIRDVLRRGATVRQERMAGYQPVVDHPVERHTRKPVTLDLPGSGPREFIGDAQTWYWYRGTGVGAEACISAALALDAWALLRVRAGIDPASAARSVMDEATTLSEAGMAYGLLLRHRPQTDAEIALWQHERLVSELEIARGQREHNAETNGGVDEQEWRTMPPNQLIIDLVGKALLADDQDQLRRLEVEGDRLADSNKDQDGHLPPEVAHSARLFRASNYTTAVQDDTVYLVPLPDPDIQAALSPSNDFLDLTMQSLGLRERFSPDPGRDGMLMTTTHLVRAREIVTPTSRLRSEDQTAFARRFPEDLALARRLSGNPLPTDFDVFGPGPQCAVAGYVLTYEASDELPLTHDDTDWAVATLLSGATIAVPFEDYNTVDERAATRTAARVLPMVFANGLHADRAEDIVTALKLLAVHTAREVRRTLITGLRDVWEAACRTTGSGDCVHTLALAVVSAIITDAVDPQSPADQPPAVQATSELAALEKSSLDAATIATSAAGAVDAAATSAEWTCGTGPAAEAAARDLVEAVIAMAEAGRSERAAYGLLAAAALRADRAAGSLGLVGSITSRLAPTGRLAIWRPAVFAAAEREPELAELLGTGWPPMALQVLQQLPEFPAIPGGNHEQIELIAVAALFPAAAAPRPTAAELSEFLPTWLTRAVNNEHAINAYAAWAVCQDVPASILMATLYVLIPDLSVPPAGLSDLANVIGHISSAALSDDQERQLNVLVDALVAAGYETLRRFQTEAT
jgi:hypothetical protein